MTSPPLFDLTLPFITEELPGIDGRIKIQPEDFIVEEISLYNPSGFGAHLYANITKKNLTTREVQLQLAELFDLKPENIGMAGLKDKYAVTTQTFSILFERTKYDPNKAVKLIEENIGIKVNWAKYHKNKIRTGHLIGNRFKIIITDIPMPLNKAVERTRSIVDHIHLYGLPNFYGEQRIGKYGKNALMVWKILHGQKIIVDRWLKKYLVSVYQSYLCNRYLAERVRRGLFKQLILGDIAKKHETGGLFWVNNPIVEQPRYIAQEISFTAPMFGYKMPHPTHKAANLEAEIFEESELSMEKLKNRRVTGTRRLGRLIPKITIDLVPRGIQLTFTLHKGGFASILLREFIKPR
jgi:tRNA pseudouridine13 synthase